MPLRDPQKCELYLQFWTQEHPVSCEILHATRGELSKTQEFGAGLSDCYFTTYAIWKRFHRPGIQYKVVYNQWVKWFYGCVLTPAIRHLVRSNPEWVRPSYAEDIMEHLFLCAFEAGRWEWI